MTITMHGLQAFRMTIVAVLSVSHFVVIVKWEHMEIN